MLTSILTPASLHAQLLWNPFAKPNPNMIIAYDTSVTMQISSGCSPGGCHAIFADGVWWSPPGDGNPWAADPASGWPGTRLWAATGELMKTLALFKDDFVYGGLRYDTCGPNGSLLGHWPPDPASVPSLSWTGSAEVTFVSPPDLNHPTASLSRVVDMVNDIRNESDSGPVGPTAYQVCEVAEGKYPDGYPGVYRGGTYCVTPNCAQDWRFESTGTRWIKSLILNLGSGSVPGITAPGFPSNFWNIAPCDSWSPYAGVYDAMSIYADLRTWEGGLWGCLPSVAQANTLCSTFQGEIDSLLSWMRSWCTNSPPAYLTNFRCDPNNVASNLCACGGGAGSEWFDNTCICQPKQNGCPLYAPTELDNCGSFLDFPGRQQVAICGAYDSQTLYPSHGSTQSNIGQALLGQSDNIVNGGCRENILALFTDAAWGATSGVQVEGDAATNPNWTSPPGYTTAPFWSDVDEISNAYLFLASPSVDSRFQPAALANALGQTAPLLATNQGTLNTSFVKIANRLKRGTVLAGGASIDTFGTRMATISVQVPGRPKYGEPSYPDADYLGRPSRVSWWPLDARTGNRGATPICETDWSTIAGFSRQVLTASGMTPSPPPDIETAIGPPLNGEVWYTGSPMLATVPDDGTFNRGPGFGSSVVSSNSGGFTLGYMLNAGQTQPVIVGAPADLRGANFQSFVAAHQNRHRTLYTLAGGYLFGFDTGTYQQVNPPADVYNIGVSVSYKYIDDPTASTACKETFRYLPGWVVDRIRTDPFLSISGPINLTLPQPYTDGQIVVREMQIDNNNNALDYATVLVMTEGASGPHLSALDVSDPTAPTVLGGSAGEWALPDPADRTSAEPTLYTFPNGSGTQAVVVMPGGDGGSANLYAYAITRSGAALLSTAALPPDNYPSDAICFDRVSRGSASDCLVLSSTGRLVRVPVNYSGQFGTPVDLLPSYQPDLGTRMAGELFYTHPAVYFDVQGNAVYAFGSGDPRNILNVSSTQNRIYLVVDRSVRSGSIDAARSCAADGSGSTVGAIDLAHVGEAVVSPPIVADGVVAFSTYLPGNDGCTVGNGYLYSFNFSSCADAITGSPRPQPVSLGPGIPPSPIFLRTSERILSQTTQGGAPALAVNGRQSSATRMRRVMLPLYWRPQIGNR